MATTEPEILAPAGDADCFLAAVAAGANAIYLGLKNFSARMEAKNFALAELARLTELARAHSVKVYVAMNNLLKTNELNQVYRLTRRLAEQVGPDGLIVQDPAMLAISRQAGFDGSIVLSTLANVCDAKSLIAARNAGADRVIIPRELSIDEMRTMGEACPQGLELECFVQGALCYCVSGRCYWSSYMGGKSGLRGRCVQPCRRQYAKFMACRERPQSLKNSQRHFSCQDLELGPVTKALLSVPNLVSWKIEGRKKGPHYVFHVVTAYRLLRDNPNDAQQRKMALEILEMALGRPGVRARFLPQKKAQPMAPHGQTSSGLLAGKITILQGGACVLKPHFALLPKDYLRIGVEDERWHTTLPVNRPVPKAGLLALNLPKYKTPKAGTPVYLIDRRDAELTKLLKQLQAELAQIPAPEIRNVSSSVRLPVPCAERRFRSDMLVAGQLRKGRQTGCPALTKRAWQCLWLSAKSAEISRTFYDKTAFWLPPAIWPEHQDRMAQMIARLLKGGARHFVCNSPWQRGFFPDVLPGDVDLVAGPFCNIANGLAIAELAALDFSAVFVSPELAAADILGLPKTSPLPLGLVLGGFWPVGLSRFGLAGLNAGDVFASPRGEPFWSKDMLGLTWIYPAWPLDLTAKKNELLAAGYSFFAWLEETPPKLLPRMDRPGTFNWDGALI